MKNPKGILTGFAATLWMFMGMDVMGQGSLTPPGAPGETMKALEQVEPRTPISSLPYTISEPGSYYVTGNLSTTGDGIIIQSSGVTVDLMGFSLTGDGAGEDGEYGIQMEGFINWNTLARSPGLPIGCPPGVASPEMGISRRSLPRQERMFQGFTEL